MEHLTNAKHLARFDVVMRLSGCSDQTEAEAGKKPLSKVTHVPTPARQSDPFLPSPLLGPPKWPLWSWFFGVSCWTAGRQGDRQAGRHLDGRAKSEAASPPTLQHPTLTPLLCFLPRHPNARSNTSQFKVPVP